MVPYVYGKYCSVEIKFVIPKLFFEILEDNKHLLPEIEDFDEKFEEVQRKLKDTNAKEEIHSIYLAMVKPKTKIRDFKMPMIREPRCELDLVYLIGRYWDIISKKTILEDIVFVDKHWDAEGIYKGKVDAKDFDKDPNKIDLLICWKASPKNLV